MSTSRNTTPGGPFPPSHLQIALGLDIGPFHAAMGAGALAQGETGVNHASNAGGTYFFHEGLATLRGELAKADWQNERSGGLEYTVHPDGRHRIFLLAGDSNTGDPLATPHSKRPRGSQGREQVIQGQMDLALAELGVTGAAATRMTTWALLHYFDSKNDIVRGEVSVPTEFNSSNMVTDWRVRIMLPVLDLGPGRIAKVPPGTPPVSFEVRRKSN